MEDQYVVVTTKMRGVFGGVLLHGSVKEEIVELKHARMCFYWKAGRSHESKGVVGLASTGPQPGSKVTGPAPRLSINNVTCIMVATPEARHQWETVGWSS